jgi:Cu/Ag efflux protein CusF
MYFPINKSREEFFVNKYKVLGACAVSCLFISASAFAADPITAPPGTFNKTGENEYQASNVIELQAQVVDVNKKTRDIKLKAKDGETTSIKAGNDVENFAQIKKGDMLKVRYLESLTLELKKGGGDPIVVSDTSDLVRAQPGQKPGAMAIDKVSAVGTITKLDKKTQHVTVKGPQRTVVIHVQKKDVFDTLKKGDQIEATYVEALAVSVESIKK